MAGLTCLNTGHGDRAGTDARAAVYVGDHGGLPTTYSYYAPSIANKQNQVLAISSSCLMMNACLK